MSAKALQHTLDRFEDERFYVKKPNVGLFDEHVEEFLRPVCDEHGNPVKDASGEIQREKVVHKFSKDVLEKIASRCNARDAAGDFCPITIGHTIKDPQAPEKSQPEPVGVARNWRTEWDEPHAKWMLKADLYFRREKYAEAETYPRTSVELWPNHYEIDPVAIIRRTPKRDTGSWAYSLDNGSYSQHFSRFDSRTGRPVTVLQYSRFEEPYMADMPPETEMDNNTDATTGPSDEERDMQFMRDCVPHMHAIHSHPDFEHVSKRYARTEEPEPEPGADGAPVGEPSATPAEDAAKAEPIQNAAYPSATNGGLPNDKKPETPPMQNARDTKPSTVAHDVTALQYSRLATVMESLVKKVDGLEQKLESKDRESQESLHFSRCEGAMKDLVSLHNRHIEDPEWVFGILKGTPADKLDEQVQKFARSLPGDIVQFSRQGFITTPTLERGVNKPTETDPNYRAAQVLAYQRDNNLWDDAEKAAKDCPANYRVAIPPMGNSPRN